MTSNQRRPGFRLPWSSEEEAAAAEAASRADNGSTPDQHEQASPSADATETADAAGQADADTAGASEFEAPAAGTSAAQEAAEEGRPEPQPEPASSGDVSASTAPAALAEADVAEAATAATSGQPSESPAGFMRDLVAAMRGVAEETRQTSLTELRTSSEDRVRTLQAETEQRSAELRNRADADIAAVGEWARAEEERIKQEAEQKVVARRAQLDQQLAAESSRAESAAAALRERVAAYERELDTYHAQLSDIADPAAFAAAAKRMPPPPDLRSPIAVPTPVEELAPRAAHAGEAAAPDAGTAMAEGSVTGTAEREAAPEDGSPANPPQMEAPLADAPHADAPQADAPQAEEPPREAAATDTATPAEPAPEAHRGETTATEVLVKGLGSFGAITGFRQALAGVEGIDGVSLSLGPTGEFVFRAIHPAGFDIAGAITSIEGDAATIEDRPEGGIRVTLDRSR